ncbi:hypothetical protein FBY39_0572 [Microbacterium sp. SLBN-146]|nr:hypothetical protein FBY39_0572 [Microbacterium sp. SLBN-146]
MNAVPTPAKSGLRSYYATVLVVAVVSIALGLATATATSQYVLVFCAQILIAALLAAWYPRVKKRHIGTK